MSETLTETIDRVVAILNEKPDEVRQDELMKNVLSTYSIRGSLCHNPEFHKYGSLPCCENIDLLPDQNFIVEEVIRKLAKSNGKKVK